MSSHRQLIKAVKDFYQQLRSQSATATKEQSHWVLRTLLVSSRRPDWVNSGFVLPTVALVALVVVLLTTAILFRAFDRSKSASNVRVNQAVMAAATPALDRARAKIDALFKDPRLPRSTPSDLSLDQVITANRSQYTLGDETPLTLKLKTGDDTLVSAWKYPVDTNNNGKFDSYTIYAIYFKTPKDTTKPRSTLEARTQPMANGLVSDQCKTTVATSADLVKAQGWYKVGSKLKRSIFVYTITVPITDPDIGKDEKLGPKYETYSGNKSFAALEYQQDRERIPLSNNAVLYNDDLSITPYPEFKLNGRVVTNSNLLTRQDPGDTSGKIRFYQVSSPASCYFEEDNGKIVVGGNVGNSNITDTKDRDDGTTRPGQQVDLFSKTIVDGDTTNRGFINAVNKTTPNLGSAIAYNSQAFEQRLASLVSDATARGVQTINGTFPNKTVSSVDPKEVQDAVKVEINTDALRDADEARKKQLDLYFRKRTRRVPYGEVPAGSDGKTTPYAYTGLVSDNGNDSLRPQDNWVFPFNKTDGTTHAGYANLAINPNTDKTKLLLSATDPQKEAQDGKETYLGDRILVGNNLPELWWDGSAFVRAEDAPTKGQAIAKYLWDTGGNTRMRYSRVKQLDDLGATDRDGFWEKNAAGKPQNDVDVVGGLRVVTGAGIYLPQGYTPNSPSFTSVPNTVWSDAMAVATTAAEGLPSDQTPYLQMRATAVYHYTQSYYDPTAPSANPQTPIACVSSYYDPTNIKTARNQQGLPDISRLADITPGTNVGATNAGNSNNGVVYAAPTKNYSAALAYQATLKYPNGRWVNEPLKKALAKGSGNLSLTDKSAIDSALCALEILDPALKKQPSTGSVIPHGAIRETAFLDARQIKAISKNPNSSKYDLDIELRQPLEIRATVLDMDVLRTSSIGGEKLLPNSGIIYATRDDALPDASDIVNDASKSGTNPNLASSDSILDPTRRPHGIMLINGKNLSRSNINDIKEKGLILASNLPVYIKGDFNKHLTVETSPQSVEEFTELLGTWGAFYARKSLNSNFACRKGQFDACTLGDSWRPTSVLADAITFISDGFQLGYRNEGDYDLRDNVGNSPLGYHYNTLINQPLDNKTPIKLNEKLLQLDLDGDGVISNNVSNVDETKLGVDLDADGQISNTSVAITEQNMPGIIAARLNGFWDNNFVTSYPWEDSVVANGGIGNPVTFDPDNSTTAPSAIKSSYFNNLVTPVQLRLPFPEYVMEICRKKVVSACLPEDWKVGSGTNPDVKASDLITDKYASAKATKADLVTDLMAGTTARPAKLLVDPDRRYPRRIAFVRDSKGQLVTTKSKDGNLRPVPIGIRGADQGTNTAPTTDPTMIDKTIDPVGVVSYFPYDSVTINGQKYDPYKRFDPYDKSVNRPRLHPSSLIFQAYDKDNNYNNNNVNYGYDYPLMIKNANGITGLEKHEQPLLVPVLQLQYAKMTSPSTDKGSINYAAIVNSDNGSWMQRVDKDVETNLVIAQGDTPARPNELNGGLENFVRYLEVWQKNSTASNNSHVISGSFIQLKRSVYATGPWQTITTDSYPLGDDTMKPSLGSVFGYPQAYATSVNNNSGNNGRTPGRTPFYSAPKRQWGFDVALLTQLPDLFSQRFTVPPTNPPNEYFREVGRDDPWVATLLCGATSTANEGYETAFSSTGVDFKYGITKDQRPSQCQ